MVEVSNSDMERILSCLDIAEAHYKSLKGLRNSTHAWAIAQLRNKIIVKSKNNSQNHLIMTKNDIAAELCKRIADLPKSTALHVVDGVADILTEAFALGENVYLRGFGTLEVKTTKEKKARNINAGATVVVPAQRIVKFKISNKLKNHLNNDAL